jgi:hypothetical protein
MSQGGDRDSIDVDVRPVSAVARRCIILLATMQRIGLAESAPEHRVEDPAAAAFDLREWLRAESLWSDLTQDERELMDSPFRPVALNGVQERVPETEAFAAIAWALGLIDELPDVGRTAFGQILASIPSPWEKSATWIASRVLRPAEEITRRREQAEIWEWRLAIESDRRLIEGRELMELEQTIRDVAREGTAVGLLHSEPVDDVSFVGESLSRLDAEQLEEFHGLAQERLVALNWLCGHGHDWDDAPLDIEGLSLD